MSRDVTLRATYEDLVGDETYELWLKHSTDAWALDDTGIVDPDYELMQEFLLGSLTTGDPYVAQIRLKRSGRYRTGYLTSNPDAWPVGSRCEFTPGALEGVDAPTITTAVWSRTSSSHTKIELTITPADTSKSLHILRDGSIVGTVSEPLSGTVTYDDLDPVLGVMHVYTAAHTAGFLDGPESTPVDCFGGPLPPASFTRTSASDQYGHYDLSWDASGAVVRVQDDFFCPEVFTAVIGPPGTTTDSTLTVNVEMTELPPGGTTAVAFHARIRSEIDSFTVTDVSDWESVLIEMLIDDTDTRFSSCP